MGMLAIIFVVYLIGVLVSYFFMAYSNDQDPSNPYSFGLIFLSWIFVLIILIIGIVVVVSSADPPSLKGWKKKNN